MNQNKNKISMFSFFLLFITTPLYPFIELDRKKSKKYDEYVVDKIDIEKQLKNKVTFFIDELHHNFSCHHDNVSLHKILMQIKQSVTLKQVLTLLNQVDESLAKKHATIEIALFMQALVILQAHTNEILLSMLVIIDNHLSYWKEMNTSPAYYLFHKSPVKWLMGKKQQQEVSNNIRLLSALQQKYFRIMGSLAKHAQAFPVQTTMEAYSCWTNKMITIMQELYTGGQTNVVDHTETMKQMIADALAYKDRALRYVNKLKPSHHFVRHWFKYALLFTGAGLVYKNRKCIDLLINTDARNQYANSFCKGWHDYFITPLREIYKTIMGSNNQKEFSLARKENVERYMKDAEERKTIASELIGAYLQKEHEVGRLTYEQRKEAWQGIQKNNIGPLQRLKGNILKPSLWNKYDFTGEIDYHSNLAQFVIWSDREKALKEFIHWVYLLDNEFKRNQMTLRFTALIPAIVTGWGLYKLVNKFYGWLTKHNYNFLKKILTEINTMLIASHGNMNDECYGNLIYSLYKLQCSAIIKIRDKNVKREFVRDIEMLSLYDFTVEEKQLLISNMRWKYDFLSFSNTC
ncbi:MAG: hypothetical protein WCD44_01245 [Candidatus Babeliales bacterium]